MKARKIFLIAADLILLVVVVVQIIAGAKSTVKVFNFQEEPDAILIDKYDGKLNILKEGDIWVINDEKYEATASDVDSMIDYAKEIRALDRVAKITNDSVRNKYEFDSGNVINVTVKAGDKVLRTFSLGKDASTGIQCYATLNGSDDIYLIDGDYRYVFDKTPDQLRTKTVYSVDSADISSVSITPAGEGTWTVSRHGDAADTVWSVSGTDITLDASKAAEWINSFNSLTTTQWHGKNDDIGGEPYVHAEIGVTGKNIKLDINVVYADPEIEGATDLFYAKCSESPYWFEIAGYVMSKYQKTPEDLQK